MNHLFITLILYFFAPQTSEARIYLVVEVDPLKEISLKQHNFNIAQAQKKADKAKSLIRKISKSFKSYDEHQLQFAFEYARKKIRQMEGNSETKHFLLDKLSNMQGKYGKEIEAIMSMIDSALATKNKSLAAASGMIEKLWAEYQKNFGARKSADDPSILEVIKSALEKVVVGLGQVYNNLNNADDNPLMKLAQLLMAPEENTKYTEDHERNSNVKRQGKPLKFAVDLFNQGNGLVWQPTLEGQLDIKVEGVGDDSGIKFTFDK